MKITVVKFNSASPLYGFSSIKPGVANILSIELKPELQAVQVKRANGQNLLHPMSSIDYISFEEEAEQPQAEKPKKAAKE